MATIAREMRTKKMKKKKNTGLFCDREKPKKEKKKAILKKNHLASFNTVLS